MPGVKSVIPKNILERAVGLYWKMFEDELYEYLPGCVNLTEWPV